MHCCRGYLPGVLLVAVLALTYSLTTADDDGPGPEGTAGLRELPSPVLATTLGELIREVDCLELDEIECEKENGKAVYEVEYEYGEVDIELEVDASGKLLSKEVNREGAEEDAEEDE